MITAEDRKIIEAEIDRLDLAYRNAQDRYAYSGSASTDRTMYKYQLISRALENYLTGNEDRSKDNLIQRQQDQLRRLRDTVGELFRAGDIRDTAYTALLKIIMEV